MRNAFVDFRGGVKSRGGFAFVGPTWLNIAAAPRTITFRFSIAVNFVLLFGDGRMRVAFQGAYVTLPPVAIFSVSLADPGVVTTDVPHGLSNGDLVYIANIQGTTQLNNNFYVAQGVAPSTFQLTDPFGNFVDTRTFAPYFTGGTVAQIYETSSPYAVGDLPYMKVTQSADVMSIACVNTVTGTEYPPYDLERFNDTDWEFVETTFESSIAAPASLTLVATATTPPTTTPPTLLTTYAQVVTAVDATTGEESQASPVAYVDSVDISATAGSIVSTWPAVTNAAYYNLYQAPPSYDAAVPIGSSFGYLGTSFGTQFVNSNITPDDTTTPPLHLNPLGRGQVLAVDVTAQGSGYSQSTAGFTISTSTGSGFAGAPIIVGGAFVAFFIQNNGENYQVGDLITITGGSGATATLTVGPESGTYPGVVSYFQERRVYAATTNNPDTLFFSQVGSYTNMDASSPPIDSDAIVTNPWAQQVNGIQWLQPMPGGLIVATGLDAWQYSGTGGAGSPISPAQQSAQPQESNGSSATLPILRVNYDLLNVQSYGTVVRDIEYNFYVNIYAGTEISLFSNHLFENYNLVQWAWAREPYRLVWAVRSDGKLLSMAYVKEQKVNGWSRHDTLGAFVSITTAAEPPVDAVYAVVQRYIPGEQQTVYYLERMDNRLWQGPEDPYCVDCGASLAQPAPNASLSASSAAGLGTLVDPMVASGGGNYSANPAITVTDASDPDAIAYGVATVVGGAIQSWTVSGVGFKTAQVRVTDVTGSGAVLSVGVANLTTFTASAPVFSPASVGQVVRMGGGVATVTNYLGPTQLVGQVGSPIVLTVPNDPNHTPVTQPSGSWTITQPISTLTNLGYIEGMTVNALADGNVVLGLIVENGSVTLPATASSIKIGPPYLPQLQALHTDVPGGATVQGKPKRVSGVTVRMEKTRGIKVGANQPIASVQDFQQEIDWGEPPYAPLQPLQDRTATMAYGQPIPLFTGDKYLPISDVWRVQLNQQSYGMVAAEQSDPLPMTILSFIYRIDIADG